MDAEAELDLRRGEELHAVRDVELLAELSVQGLRRGRARREVEPVLRQTKVY